MKNNPTYDCHGKTYYDVEDQFPNWLLLNSTYTPLHVITGNSDGMKNVVVKILKEYDFNYMISPDNNGKIIVL
ncbi:hypothetical protein EBU71_20905 [bacterium]|nr:hypothetical protein [Candidatus Elulimicrobium humile]